MPNEPIGLRVRKVRRAALTSLVVNVFLAVLKGYAGAVAGSRALLADSVHTLSDLTTDVAVVVGSKYWDKPPDENHPLGHSGFQTAVSMFIGLMLLATGVGIAMDSFAAMSNETAHRSPGMLAFFAALLSFLIKEVLYRWTLKKARETGSGALAANALHQRSDGFSSVPVLFAVTASILSRSLFFLDGIAGVVVSVFIVKAGLKVLQPVFGEVTNVAPPAEVITKLENAARQVDGVISIHRFRARMQGGGIYVDMHLQVSREKTVEQGYVIGKCVEESVKQSDSSVKDVIARVEPFSPCGDVDSCSRISDTVYSRCGD